MTARVTDLHTLVTEYTRRLWNEHDLSAVDDFVPEHTLLIDRAGNEYASRSDLRGRVEEVLWLMPDHRLDVWAVVADEQSVIFQWENYGHWTDGDRGAFPVRFGGITYWKVVDGRIVARDGVADVATFGWQIGIHRRRIRLLIPV